MGGFAVAERFLSLQGEGLHAGRRAYFIRLFGCNVRCQWCDSKSAWEGQPSENLTAEGLAAAAAESKAEIAVITGGEPCLYDLRPLLRELSARSIAAHLETSATLPIMEDPDAKFSWVTASPKFFCEPLATFLARADELKFIISEPSDLSKCEKIRICRSKRKGVLAPSGVVKGGRCGATKKNMGFRRFKRRTVEGRLAAPQALFREVVF